MTMNPFDSLVESEWNRDVFPALDGTEWATYGADDLIVFVNVDNPDDKIIADSELLEHLRVARLRACDAGVGLDSFPFELLGAVEEEREPVWTQWRPGDGMFHYIDDSVFAGPYALEPLERLNSMHIGWL